MKKIIIYVFFLLLLGTSVLADYSMWIRPGFNSSQYAPSSSVLWEQLGNDIYNKNTGSVVINTSTTGRLLLKTETSFDRDLLTLYGTGVNGGGITFEQLDGDRISLVHTSSNGISIYDTTGSTNQIYNFADNGIFSIINDDGGIMLTLTDTETNINTANPIMSFNYGTTPTRLGYVGYGSTSNSDIYITNDEGSVRLRSSDGDSKQFVVASNGNNGFGTDSPDELVHAYKSNEARLLVESGDGSSAVVKVKNTEGEYGVYTNGGYLGLFDYSDNLPKLLKDENDRWIFGGSVLDTTNPTYQFNSEDNIVAMFQSNKSDYTRNTIKGLGDTQMSFAKANTVLTSWSTEWTIGNDGGTSNFIMQPSAGVFGTKDSLTLTSDAYLTLGHSYDNSTGADGGLLIKQKVNSVGEGIKLFELDNNGFQMYYDGLTNKAKFSTYDSSSTEIVSFEIARATGYPTFLKNTYFNNETYFDETVEIEATGTNPSLMVITDTGNNPAYFTRDTGGITQSLNITVNDYNTVFQSVQDENAGEYGGFDFVLDGDGTAQPSVNFYKGNSLLTKIDYNGAIRNIKTASSVAFIELMENDADTGRQYSTYDNAYFWKYNNALAMTIDLDGKDLVVEDSITSKGDLVSQGDTTVGNSYTSDEFIRNSHEWLEVSTHSCAAGVATCKNAIVGYGGSSFSCTNFCSTVADGCHSATDSSKDGTATTGCASSNGNTKECECLWY